jgi:hypothetical protein
LHAYPETYLTLAIENRGKPKVVPEEGAVFLVVAQECMARPFVVDGPPQIAQSWLVLIGSLEKAEVLTDSLRRGISRELLESLIRVHCRCIWKGRIDHGEGGGAFGREASARCGDAWLLGLRPTTIQRSNFFQESIHFCNMRCKQSVEYAFPNKPQGQTKQLPER